MRTVPALTVGLAGVSLNSVSLTASADPPPPPAAAAVLVRGSMLALEVELLELSLLLELPHAARPSASAPVRPMASRPVGRVMLSLLVGFSARLGLRLR